MIVPSIVKSTAAVFAVGIAVATISSNAEDGTNHAGRALSKGTAVTLPVEPDGQIAAEATTAIAGPAELPEDAVIATMAQAAPSSPARPVKPPTEWVRTSPPESVPVSPRAPATPWTQPNPPTAMNDEQFNLEMKTLANPRQYPLAKAKGYEVLAEVYKSKAKNETGGGYSRFEVMEARGQWMLNSAESDRLQGEADLIEGSAKLLQKQREANVPAPPTPARIPNANRRPNYPNSMPSHRRPPVSQAAPKLQSGQQIKIHASGTMNDEPINGMFTIEPQTGSVALGPSYGRVKVEGLELLEAEEAILHHLEAMLKNPKVQVTVPFPAVVERQPYVPQPPHATGP